MSAMKAAGKGRVYDIWQQAGGKTTGSWPELFGWEGGEIMTALSISSFINEVAKAGKVGVTHFLAKPFSLADLGAAVDRALDRRQRSMRVTRLADSTLNAELPIPGVIGSSSVMRAIADRVRQLANHRAPVLIVAEAGLGTLNHTSLTLEALAAKGVSCAGLVIGSWPAQPGAAEKSNRDALAGLASVRAALPAGVATMSTADFTSLSARAFDPDWVAGL